MSDIDVAVTPQQLRDHLGISATTLRDHMHAAKIPPFDKVLTRKTRYWHRSTLVRAGLLSAHQELASPPTPASSDAAQA